MGSLSRLLCAALFLSGCATQINTSYRGPDAGVLVASIGYTEPKGEFYDLFFAETGSGHKPWGVIGIHTEPDIYRTLDYTGRDTGSVDILHLKPGAYEIYRVEEGPIGNSYISARPFSIPFTIKPGETTYVGSYTGIMVGANEKTLFGDNLKPAGVYFVVSDKHERDIAVARRREPTLPPVTVNVPDPAQLPKPYFR
jgi:hypothetical protein